MLSSLLKFLVRRPLQARRTRRARALLEAGLSQERSGNHAGARGSLERAVELDPDNADARYWLGILLFREQSYAASARHFERALALNPEIPDGWINLGSVYYFQRDLARAGASFRAALAAAPGSASAHLNLGVVLKASGRFDEALVHLRRAYELAPEAEGTLHALVGGLVESDRCEEALSVASRAVERDPASREAHLQLGFAHQKLHDPERALACYDTVTRMGAADAEYYNNRGVALQDLGRLPEALEDYEHALALQPEFPLAAFHLALARLLVGDYQRGWEGYEARRLSGDYPRRSSTLPQWEGSPLAGRRILVYGEQGLGDEIMFASILPQIVAAAGRCLIECDPRLLGIFSRSFPSETVRAALPDRSLSPEMAALCPDVEIAAGSLPMILRRKPGDFLPHGGYLKADPERVAYWRGRLARLGTGLKVGISWTGGVRKTRRPLRSIPLERWLPILAVPGVRFVSLQYTAGAGDEVMEVGKRHGVEIVHWSEAVEDYEETAALVCALDLVVSVCTAVIHLGGALGRPVWVMAPYSPEWRYGFSGDTMPWYSSVRIFRQPAFGAWDPVIGFVAAELGQLAGAPGS